MSSRVLMPSSVNTQLNLGAAELEYIDPTPDIHALFLHFDQLFFESKLKRRAAIRWSKRMYSCAGICSYEGLSGFCEIALSEPLLKLRPRKNLVETLLHEMIHGFLFITDRDRDRDGHGPKFHYHMHRINKLAGINITVYHDFHEEVELYQTHWWRCNGICQNSRPHYGIVRRTMNRAPGPSDHWWSAHKRWCGGTFTKIKQPEPQKKASKAKKIPDDIVKPPNPIKKLTDNYLNKTKATAVVIGKENTDHMTQSSPVQDKVRNVWSNFPYPSKTTVITINTSTVKHKIETTDTQKPKRVKKIDDYFKQNATTLLKDIYGESLELVQSEDSKKLKAVIEPEAKVNCPVCNRKVPSSTINSHIDECLNKDLIEKYQKEHTTTDLDSSKNTAIVKSKVYNVQDNQPVPSQLNNSNIEVKTNQTSIIIKQEVTEELDKFPLNNVIEIVPKPVGKMEYSSIKTEIMTEPSTSHKTNNEIRELIHIQECACCGEMIQKPMQEHLEECLAFFNNNTTIPDEGPSQSTSSIIIDDEDDEFNESQVFNPTGTKFPCPCCLQMIENDDMNSHLDTCLN